MSHFALTRTVVNDRDVFVYTDKLLFNLQGKAPEVEFEKTDMHLDYAPKPSEAKQEGLGECFIDASLLAILYQNPYFIKRIIIKEDPVKKTAVLRAFIPQDGQLIKTYFELDISDLVPYQIENASLHPQFHQHAPHIALILKLYGVVATHVDLINGLQFKPLKSYLHGGHTAKVLETLTGEPVQNIRFDRAQFQNELANKLKALAILHYPELIQLDSEQIEFILHQSKRYATDLKNDEANENFQSFCGGDKEMAEVPTEFAQDWYTDISGFLKAHPEQIDHFIHFINKLGNPITITSEALEENKICLPPCVFQLLKRHCELELPHDIWKLPASNKQTGIQSNLSYTLSHYALFSLFEKHIREGDFVTASTKRDLNARDAMLKHVMNLGLVQNHAYAVINAERRKDAEGKERLFLWVKNPWQQIGFTYKPKTEGGFEREPYYTEAPASHYAEFSAQLDALFGSPNNTIGPIVGNDDFDIRGVSVIELSDFLQHFDSYAICPNVEKELYAISQIQKILVQAAGFLWPQHDNLKKWIEAVNQNIESYCMHGEYKDALHEKKSLDTLINFIVDTYPALLPLPMDTAISSELHDFIVGLTPEFETINHQLNKLAFALNYKLTLSSATLLQQASDFGTVYHLSNLSSIKDNQNSEFEKLLQAGFILECNSKTNKLRRDIQHFFQRERLYLHSRFHDKQLSNAAFQTQDENLFRYQELQKKLTSVAGAIQEMASNLPHFSLTAFLVKKGLTNLQDPQAIIDLVWHHADQTQQEKLQPLLEMLPSEYQPNYVKSSLAQSAVTTILQHKKQIAFGLLSILFIGTGIALATLGITTPFGVILTGVGIQNAVSFISLAMVALSCGIVAANKAQQNDHVLFKSGETTHRVGSTNLAGVCPR